MQKPKLREKQFLLVINGPSCGGKSTVVDLFVGEYGNIFQAKSDTIKWLISDYTALLHRDIVHEMTLGAMMVALKNGLSVIKEGASYNAEKYAMLAKEFNVDFFAVNIEAPWEIILERFAQRLEQKKTGVKKIANTDPVRLRELYEMYLTSKDISPLTFDSSKQSAEEIRDAIIEYIKK